jgi:hypothetical protein
MSGLHSDGRQGDAWFGKLHAAERDLKHAGLDLIRWFSVDEANRNLPSTHRLPNAGTTGLVVGNTRALWDPFLRRGSSRPRTAHPLDRYVEDSVREALAPLLPTWLRFAHQLFPSPIPIQRYAAASGLAQMSPVGLSVHPEYGPWIALRAVAVFVAPSLPATQESAPHPCDSCARPCVEPFERAIKDPARKARTFLPVRQSCPVGVGHRYSDEQVNFHYGPEPLGDA